MKRILVGALKLSGLFLIMIVIAALIPKVGIVVSTIGMVAGGVAVVRPLPKIGLGHRGFAFTIAMAVGAFGLLMSFGAIERDKQRAETGQRLTELRLSDQDAYLRELKAFDEERWLAELQALRPAAYQAEMDHRAQLAAEAAAAEAAREEAERLAEEAEREAEAERRAEAEQAEADARVTEILRAARAGDWSAAEKALGRLQGGDLAEAQDEIEAAALAV